MDQLQILEEESEVVAHHDAAPARFRHLIRTLHQRTGRPVAILVDEYDKPILDALDAPEVARANSDFLRGLYAVVKDCDAHIRFSFITGVSKFSKVSLFSGLNNLKDITLNPRYSAICGYTEVDLDTVFAPELGDLDREQVRDWYNGYSWRGADKVYNPFDILLLFDTREFPAHWFETGTPTFLVDTLFRRRVSSLALDGMLSNAELLSTFDVDDMPTEALLFQTGYLTIERPEPRGAEMFYRLGYPNREVRQSLNRSLLNRMTGDASRPVAHSARLYDLLLVNDFTGWRRWSSRSSPAFRTSGTRTTTSRATRASTPACSTRTSRGWGWTWWSRTAAATAGWTWRCVSTTTSTCSSSRWWSWRPRARLSRS